MDSSARTGERARLDSSSRSRSSRRSDGSGSSINTRLRTCCPASTNVRQEWQYPGPVLDEQPVFSSEDVALLRELCEGSDLHFEMTRELLDLERQHRARLRRAGLLPAIGACDHEELLRGRRGRHRACSAERRSKTPPRRAVARRSPTRKCGPWSEETDALPDSSGRPQ